MKISTSLVASVLMKVAEYFEHRKAEKEAKRIAKIRHDEPLMEWQVDDLNADLREYHRTGKAPYDSTIAKHLGGKNPTTRIDIRDKAKLK